MPFFVVIILIFLVFILIFGFYGRNIVEKILKSRQNSTKEEKPPDECTPEDPKSIDGQKIRENGILDADDVALLKNAENSEEVVKLLRNLESSIDDVKTAETFYGSSGDVKDSAEDVRLLKNPEDCPDDVNILNPQENYSIDVQVVENSECTSEDVQTYENPRNSADDTLLKNPERFPNDVIPREFNSNLTTHLLDLPEDVDSNSESLSEEDVPQGSPKSTSSCISSEIPSEEPSSFIPPFFDFSRKTPELVPRMMSEEFESLDRSIEKRKLDIRDLLRRIDSAKRQHRRFSEHLERVKHDHNLY